MGRRPCCDKVGLKKGPWTIEEDKKLINFIFNNGQCCWRAVPKLAGLLRCGKSCRLRWINYLRPDLRRGILSEVEEKLVIQLHSQLGNRWSKIASYLPGRTDNEIKNHWNTHIKKKLKKMGIDDLTHKPLSPTMNDDRQDQKLHEQPLKDQLSSHCSEKMDAKDGETEFCIDEVPLIQPHEMLNLIAPISSTSSSSSSSFIIHDNKNNTLGPPMDIQLSSFDWENFWGDDQDFSMDILIDKKFNL